AAGALTLLHDNFDRRTGGCEAGHGGQLRPLEDLGRRLRVRRPDEDVRLAVAVDEVGESPLDAAVEMTDRVPLLGTAGQLRIVVGWRPHMTDPAKALGIAQRHSLCALEEHEMPQCPLAKQHSTELYVRRIAPGNQRDVAPPE